MKKREHKQKLVSDRERRQEEGRKEGNGVGGRKSQAY